MKAGFIISFPLQQFDVIDGIGVIG